MTEQFMYSLLGITDNTQQAYALYGRLWHGLHAIGKQVMEFRNSPELNLPPKDSPTKWVILDETLRELARDPGAFNRAIEASGSSRDRIAEVGISQKGKKC
jgi:hypothetical protein